MLSKAEEKIFFPRRSIMFRKLFCFFIYLFLYPFVFFKIFSRRAFKKNLWRRISIPTGKLPRNTQTHSLVWFLEIRNGFQESDKRKLTWAIFNNSFIFCIYILFSGKIVNNFIYFFHSYYALLSWTFYYTALLLR